MCTCVIQEHSQPLPIANNKADAQKECFHRLQKHGSLHVNVLVAAEMASNPQRHDAGALPQFSYEQAMSNSAFKKSSFRKEPWNEFPRLSPTAMVPTDSPSGDTQPISQSVYDNILKQAKLQGHPSDRHHLKGFEASNNVTTQQSPNDTGNLDLLAELEDTLPVGRSSGDGPVSAGDDPDSSPTRYQQFPESQRFVDHTPQNQRNTNGSIDTPLPSNNPFTQTNKTPASVMALSQLFNATQALSSPLANVPRTELSSDMPSPNLPVQSRQTVSSIFSPLHTSSPRRRSSCVEPRANYVSMKASQEVRARLERHALSMSNHPSEDHSEDEFLDDNQLLQRRLRQRTVEDELRKQFECVKAPPRPHSSIQPRASPMFSRSSRTDDHNEIIVSVPRENNRNVGTQHDVGPESELETEQEDEDAVVLIASSQIHMENEEDDKENVDSSCSHSSNPTALAHDALSQALIMEEGPPTPRGRLTEVPDLIVRASQPQDSGHINIVSGRNTVSEERILHSQSSSDGNTNLQTASDCSFKTSDVAAQEPSILPSLSSRVEHSPAEAENSSPANRAKEIIQPRISLTQVPASSSSRSKHISPGALNSPKVMSPIGSQKAFLHPAGSPLHTANHRMESNADEDVHMVSFVFETPAPQTHSPRELQHTIPETSPGSNQVSSSALRYSYSNPESNRMAPDSDGDLPAMSHINSQDGRRIGAAGGSRKSKSNRFLSILSSPSGRPRRSMTDIALDKSPQQSVPDIPLEDISILNADDDVFQEIVSDTNVPKKRKTNNGRSIPSFFRLNLPRSQNRQIMTNDEPMFMAETDSRGNDLKARDSKILGRWTRTKPCSKSVWEVDDAPLGNVQNRKPHQTVQQAQECSSPPRPSSGGKSPLVAEAVVIHSRPISSPTPTERIPSDPPTMEDNSSTDHAETTVVFPSGIHDFSNQVFAFFNGQPHGYYPATCVGMSNDISRQRYQVLFEDAESPDELSITSVKKLEIQINDTVKVFSLDLPKIPYRVVGLADKIDPQTYTQRISAGLRPLTDIHGHTSVILTPKQERKLASGQQTVTVPISRIYLDKNLWSRLGLRTFSFNASILSSSMSRLQTPTDCGITSFTPVLTRTPRKEVSSMGIFSGMAFAVSYTHNEKELSRLKSLIFKNGGRILKEGFDELFELPSLSSPVTENDRCYSLRLTSRADQLGFACLITDNYSRRPKYMQALALNLPCLAGQWVIDCAAKRKIVDWEPYLLAAGSSMVLRKAVKSRILPPYPAAVARFNQTIKESPKHLAGHSVFFVTGRGIAAEQRKPYAFFTYAMGPEEVFHVQDVETAIRILHENHKLDDNKIRSLSDNCVWIYAGDEDAAKIARKLLASSSGANAPHVGGARGLGRLKKRKKSSTTDDLASNDTTDEYLINGKTVKILDNEYICQALIFGGLFDGWLAIQQEGHQS